MADVIQKIRFKRGAKAVLIAKLIGDNKPLAGEPIYETDTGKFKIGDGVKNYGDLPYISGEAMQAGYGIIIENNTIKVNDEVIASQADLAEEAAARALKDTELEGRIEALEGRGRFLSTWDCSTGKPDTYPQPTAYPYVYEFKSGDYYLVSKVAENSLRPKGTQISKASSEAEWIVGNETETASVGIGDQYTFDGSKWTLIGSGKQGKVTQIECNENDSHAEKLAEIVNPKPGDIAVIKALIYGDKRQYTAYVRNESEWIAMDGNYNAENVYFSKDIIYTKAIGELDPVPSTGSATLAAKGKNVKQIFDSILAKEYEAEVTMPVSLTINSSNIGEKEAGEKVSIAYSTTFNPGSYKYGPATGITASDYKILFNSQTLTGVSGTFNEVQVIDSTNLKITGTFDHTQGAIPVTNLGNERPDIRIQAANDKAAKEKGTLTGYRKMFYGTRTDKTDLDSDKIRSLSGEKQAAKTVDVSIPVGAFRTIIAVPNNRTVASIKDVNGMGAEILSSFAQITLNVEGANNYSAIQYNIYYLDYAEAIDKANIYKVTIK